MLSSQDDGADDPVDLPAGQKMISAISGSLLTALLGELLRPTLRARLGGSKANQDRTVTPLDVVRVRLQSQGSSQPAADFQRLAISTPNAFRPSNIGVTACCREVFFMNNNVEGCIAAPAGSAATNTAIPANCPVEQAQKRTFTTTFDGLRKIARHEGFTTLWRGLSPTLVMSVPGNIIYFTGYDWLRFNKTSPIYKIASDDYAPLVAGSFSRVLAAAAVGPIELFRTRLQASSGSTATGHFVNTLKGVKEMVSELGYRSLWRGLPLTLWRDVPFSGMYWWGYETIRGKLTDLREERRGRSVSRDSTRSRTRARSRSQSRENHVATLMDSFAAGGLSGAFASVATMPFDVGKTRTQVFYDSSRKAGASGALAPEEQSMMRLLWHIVSTEGVSGLWKGWIPRTLKVAPSCAIMISSYEVGKRAFRSMNERKERKLHQRESEEER